MNEILQELVSFLKEASPAVWAALVRQVYVEAGMKLVWAAVCVVVCILLAKLGNYGKNQYEENPDSDWEFGLWFVVIGLAVVALLAVGLLLSAVGAFVNPEFYAIKFIVQSLGQ